MVQKWCSEKNLTNIIQSFNTLNINKGFEMASIYKRKNKNGTNVWRAVIRIKGYPTVCDHFDRKQEAEDWAQTVERQIKLGQFKFDQHKIAIFFFIFVITTFSFSVYLLT